MKHLIWSASCWAQEVGIALIRIGIGVLFIFHGYPKITGGEQTWLWLGSQMSNLGIYAFPLYWGFVAACTEFFGGILLTAGLATRFACFLLAFQMFVACMYHLNNGDSFKVYSHSLALMIVFIGLMIAGPGRCALDNLIMGR